MIYESDAFDQVNYCELLNELLKVSLISYIIATSQ